MSGRSVPCGPSLAITVLEREASDVAKLCILCFHGALLTDLAPDLCSEEGRHSPTQMCLFSPGDDGWRGRGGRKLFTCMVNILPFLSIAGIS